MQYWRNISEIRHGSVHCPISSLIHKTSLDPVTSLHCALEMSFATLCSISYLVSCIVHNSAGVFMLSRSLYRYCILILYRNILLKYCTQNTVLEILNMVHVYSKVWIFMFSRRLYSRYWSQRISSQLLLSQI